MHGNKRHIARAALLLSGLLFTLNLSLAQDSVEPAPLVPISSENVTQLTRWVPFDQNGQQAQEWIPVARGTLLDIDQSPNDALIAVGSSTGVYLFDTSHLQQAPQHIAELYETTRGIFSPDGTKIVLQTETQQLYVYNVGSGTVVDLAAAAGSVRLGGLKFSPDSGSVFAASYDNENRYHIVEWNADTGAQRARFELPEISAYISASRPYQVFIPFTVTEDRLITWHPLAVSVSNATTVVQTWDRDSHAEQQRFDLPVDVAWFFYSAAHNVFISSGYTNDYEGAVVWDASTGSRVDTISVPGSPTLAADGAAVWFYAADRSSMSVWDIASGAVVQQYTFPAGQYINYVSNEQLITSDAQGVINVWQVSGETLRLVDSVQAFTGGTGEVLFTSTGEQLVVVLGSAGLQVWDTASWTTANFIAVEEYIGAAALSPDNQSAAVTIGDYAPGEKLRFYNLATGEVIAAATYPQTINSVAYHPTEAYVAAGRSGAFDVALYSTISATMLGSYAENGIPLAVAFSPDGSLLASGNADTNVRVYNLETGGTQYVLTPGSMTNDLAFSHDGSILATGAGVLSLWDAASGAELHHSDYMRGAITDLAFSPDDSLIAAVTERVFAVWEVSSGRLLWQQAITANTPHIAFHPDGTMIAVSNGGVTLWVVNTGADGDGDSVDDVLDACPTQAGDINGCPDSDGDGLLDQADACPNETGTAAGCPDEDGDGVGNADDVCPQEIGSAAANGCPDGDGDGVVDSADLCPTTAGVAQFGGCPDSDADNIADADDACPLYAGGTENNGCPQTGHTNANANIRATPSTSGTVVRSVPPSEAFYIIGRNAAGDWLQVVLDPQGEAIVAWVYQSLVVTDIDLSTLPIVD